MNTPMHWQECLQLILRYRLHLYPVPGSSEWQVGHPSLIIKSLKTDEEVLEAIRAVARLEEPHPHQRSTSMPDSLRGRNICVVSLTTRRNPADCLHCHQPFAQHEAFRGYCPPEIALAPEQVFQAIGWENKAALGLAIGCYYDYRDGEVHWFDTHDLPGVLHHVVERQCLLVSFNGISFHFALMRAILRFDAEHSGPHDANLWTLCDRFKGLCASSYDVLAALWEVVPRAQRTKGTFTLNALSATNGYGTSLLDSAEAPRFWAGGRIGLVNELTMSSMYKTKKLFEHVCSLGVLSAGDGRMIPLRRPVLPD